MKRKQLPQPDKWHLQKTRTRITFSAKTKIKARIHPFNILLEVPANAVSVCAHTQKVYGHG